MKADLSRDTYLRQHRHARVLMQQGRVLLDADWNEQVSILLGETRRLAADLIGPHGGPGDGFRITCSENPTGDVQIGWGRYYVDGICAELLPEPMCPPAEAPPPPLRYTAQPDYPFPVGEDDPAELEPGMRYLMYLDVWERHLNALQAPDIREVALGGPDTATRSQVVAQVKAVALGPEDTGDGSCNDLLDRLVGAALRRPRCLRARARVEMPSEDPCLVPPTAQYRGPENQLYRVEIHAPGTAGDGAAFKWSRNNGSVVFGVLSLQGAVARLASLGPDRTCSLEVGDWVEIVDDVSELLARPRPLRQVAAIDRVTAAVTLRVGAGETLPVFGEVAETHPFLRRWDQPTDAIPVQESRWIGLEDGVQVWFEQGGDYKVGDHWLIPTRTEIGDVLWPKEIGPDGSPRPKAVGPHGIAHHIAPLRRIELDGTGRVACGDECRCVFPSLCAVAAALAAEETPQPQPQPEERVVPLGAILFEAQSAVMLDQSRTVLRENVRRLTGAQAASELVRVDLRSLGPETGPGGLALGVRRGEAVRAAYVEAGIRAALIPAASVATAAAPNGPGVETDMVLSRRSVPVIEVNGVGPASAERLAAEGITDAAALSRLDANELARILTPPGGRSFSVARAEGILAACRAVVGRG